MKHSKETTQHILAAYPSALSNDVKTVLEIIPRSQLHGDQSWDRIVEVESETLRIPYRVYFDEAKDRDIEKLTDTQGAILATLYTRHANGYVREKWLSEIPANAVWQAPFVALLIGEYVAEIAERVYSTSRFDKEFFAEFVIKNHELCRYITARIITYWDLFYSGKRITLEDDPITGTSGTIKVKYPPDLPLLSYPGYLAAEKTGVWMGRKPRNRHYRKRQFIKVFNRWEEIDDDNRNVTLEYVNLLSQNRTMISQI